MKRKSTLINKTVLMATIVFAVPASAQTYFRPGVRTAVQAPLHAAIILTFREKNIKAAMAKIAEAETVPNKTPDETDMIRVVGGTIEQAIFQMGAQQHVTVSPAQVDARIAELRAEHTVPLLSVGLDLRNYITAQIVVEKIGH